MKHKFVFLSLSLLSVIFLVSSVNADELSVNSHDIEITTGENSLSVEEIIKFQTIQNGNVEFISFWIQDESSEVRIIYKGAIIQYNDTSDNYYTINSTSLNLINDIEPRFTIDYKLVKSSESFYHKELLRNTSSLKVVFDDSEIFTSNNFIAGTTLTLKLYQPKETTLSLYYIIGIVLLIVLVVVAILYTKKKQKVMKVKKISSASEELLSTKKELLMNLLKDIEKQHRGKEISDDTYHKLKEQYKQEAVETMKQIEDMSSKIK